MAIVVYPADGWNSFVSIQDATDGLNQIGGGAKWGALSLEEQETLLVVSAMLLSSVATPSDKCPFPQAQILLLQFDLQNDGGYLSFTVSPDGEYKRASVGSISVEYNLGGNDIGMGGSASSLPPIVESLLSGCLMSSQGRVEGFRLV